MLRITQTDSKTNLIADGGFFIDLTMVMSDGFNVFNAASAAFNAGMASYEFSNEKSRKTINKRCKFCKKQRKLKEKSQTQTCRSESQSSFIA